MVIGVGHPLTVDAGRTAGYSRDFRPPNGGTRNMQSTDAIYPSLRDRVVLVSGGATGIGAAHVAHFAAQGAQVAFLDIQDAPAAALVEKCAAAGHAKPHFIHVDLRDIGALQAAIAVAARELGPPTVLVNNAAH